MPLGVYYHKTVKYKIHVKYRFCSWKTTQTDFGICIDSSNVSWWFYSLFCIPENAKKSAGWNETGWIWSGSKNKVKHWSELRGKFFATNKLILTKLIYKTNHSASSTFNTHCKSLALLWFFSPLNFQSTEFVSPLNLSVHVWFHWIIVPV